MIRKRTNDRSQRRPRPSSLWWNCTTLSSLKQIHASLVVRGFNSNPWALRELVFSASMVVMDAIDYAHQIFHGIWEPDTFMWNTIIRGCTQSRRPLRAVSLYTQMEERGANPDNFTYPFLLKACSMLEWLRLGLCVHGKIIRKGFSIDKHVTNTLVHFHANCGDLGIARQIFEKSTEKSAVPWSALIAGYAKKGHLEEARKLFDEMPIKDLVSWNVMITAYVKRGEMESARTLFDEAPEKDVVTWNSMISGYVLAKQDSKALKVFEEMSLQGVRPDEVTLLNLLSSCAESGNLELGEKLHSLLISMSSSVSLLAGNALVDMYSKCGSIEKAREVFDGMKQKDASTWNSLIVGLAFHGHHSDAIQVFKKMMEVNRCKPNEITFVGVLVACSHSGRVKEGRKYFDMMKEVYGMRANVRHYGCLVDMLGRVGQLEEAFDVVEKMEVEANAVVWRTLLNACKIHGNVELARLANQRLAGMRRDHSGDYVLLSNLYAYVGEWAGAERVRCLMDDNGVRKAVGCSLTGVVSPLQICVSLH